MGSRGVWSAILIFSSRLLFRSLLSLDLQSSRLLSSVCLSIRLSICPSTVAVVINDETHNSLLGWDTSACMFKLLPVVSLIWVEINMAFTVTLEGRGPCIDVQMSFQGIWCFCSLFSKEMAWYMSWWCLLAFSRVLLEPGIVWTEIADVKLSDNVVSLQRKMRRKGLGKAVIDFFFWSGKLFELKPVILMGLSL